MYALTCILPYLTTAVCVLFTLKRVWVWVKLYNPAVILRPGPASVRRVWKRQYRPTILLYPGIEGGRRRFLLDVKGFVFFWGLLKRDPVLWAGTWPYHVALLAVLSAHSRFVFAWPEGAAAGTWVDAAGGLLLVSAVYLSVRRLVVKRVREITSRVDVLAEILLIAVVVTGMALGGSDSLSDADARSYVRGLLTLSPSVPAGGMLFSAHLAAVQGLMVVFPFSHLLHAGGIFMSRRFLGAPNSLSGDVASRPAAH